MEKSQTTFSEIVHNRYATKKFDGKRLPDQKVDALLEIIRYAASSYNMQPWKILVISDQKLKEKLAPAAYNQPQITTSSHLLVFCADSDLKHRIQLIANQIGETAETKEYLDALKGLEANIPKDKQLAWAQRQLYIALGNAVNGAKSLGFDSCPMEGFNPEEFAKILKLPKNIVPTALVAIGHAADTARPKTRLPPEVVFEKRN
jgi:nitroreductase / dihydropteridine reductase